MLVKFWLGLAGLGLILGLVTLVKVFSTGFVVYAKTDVLVWTLPLATYVFFSLTSAGLAFISSLPLVFGLKRYELIEKRVLLLELSALAAAMVCLIMHLGAPLNVVYLLLSPNLASPLWWLSILYLIYSLVLLVSFKNVYSGRASKNVGVLVLLVAVLTSTGLGWLLGMADARPSLNASFLTVFFPLTALASGLAAIILFGQFFSGSERDRARDKDDLYDEMAKILGVVVGFVLVLILWRTVIGGLSSADLGFTGFRRMLGSLSYHVQLWIGLVLPLALLLVPGVRTTSRGKMLAGLAVLIGLLFGRLEFILSAEVVPLGAMAEGGPGLVGYGPTIWEVFVTVFGVSLMLLIYGLGDRFLKLEPTHV